MSAGIRSVLRRLVRGRTTIEDVWLVLPVLGLFIVLNLTVIRPNDFWWHLRTGQIIVETRHIPLQDLFSFTRAGEPWVNQSWLMEVLFYLLYRAGGLALIIFFQTLVITAGYVFVEAAALAAAQQVRPAAWAVLAAILIGADSWNLRPQAISFLLFGAVLWVLERDRRTEDGLVWGLPVLFVLWGNLHGGFIFGLGLLVIYAGSRALTDGFKARRLGRSTRRLLAVGGLSLLALAVNPAGPAGLIQYVLGFFRSATTQQLNIEFAALSIREPDGLCFFAVVTLFLGLAYRRRVTLPGVWLAALLAFGLYTLYSRRMAPWFGIVAAPALAFVLATPPAATTSETSRGGPHAAGASGAGAQPAMIRIGSKPAYLPGKAALNSAIIGLLLILALFSMPWLRPTLPLPPQRRAYALPAETPARAAEALCALGSATRVFNEMGYGSYLAWACPTVPVFVDTRIELYPAALWQEYVRVSAGQFGWEAILRKYGVNAILASKKYQQILIDAVQTSVQWRVIYQDDYAILFQRVLL